MNKKKMTGILASLLIAAGVMAGCSSSTSNGSSDSSTIKIGANLELSGGTASFGQSVDEGLQLALEEINKNGKTILMATHDYALILKYPHKTIKCDGESIFEVV